MKLTNSSHDFSFVWPWNVTRKDSPRVSSLKYQLSPTPATLRRRQRTTGKKWGLWATTPSGTRKAAESDTSLSLSLSLSLYLYVSAGILKWALSSLMFAHLSPSRAQTELETSSLLWRCPFVSLLCKPFRLPRAKDSSLGELNIERMSCFLGALSRNSA